MQDAGVQLARGGAFGSAAGRSLITSGSARDGPRPRPDGAAEIGACL